METQVFVAKENEINAAQLQQAAEIINAGGLVAFPTETVYGLGGNALDPMASKRIYAAKGRPSDNPLIVHICEFNQLESIVNDVPPEARMLAEKFWPGPLTMILNKNETVPYETTGGLDTVAVRMPSHPVALQFICASGCMIAAPSANTSGRPSPTTAAHVVEDLSGRIEAIIDGGEVGIGIESTIIDLTEAIPTILRPGYITLEDLQQVLGQVRLDPGLSEENKSQPPKAPGMRYRHYAPKAELTLVEGQSAAVVSKICELAEAALAKGQKVGIIATDETCHGYSSECCVLSMGKRADEAEIAQHLYGVLREFDAIGVDVIYSESFAEEGIGQAIMNRLLKAAGHKRIFTSV